MKIIDVHNHLGVSPDGGESYLPDILKNMQTYGISRTVVFAIDESDAGQNFERVNRKVLAAQRQHPQELLTFARVVPGPDGSALQEFQYCLEQGVCGLKLKALDGFAPEDAFPLLDQVKDRADFPVLVHASHQERSRPQDWEPLIRTYPQLTFILAHGGKDCYRQCAELLAKYENAYADTSTLSYNRTKVLYRKVGADKILFASDFPYSHPAIELKKFEVLISDQTDLSKILYGNAARLLKI